MVNQGLTHIVTLQKMFHVCENLFMRNIKQYSTLVQKKYGNEVHQGLQSTVKQVSQYHDDWDHDSISRM